MSKARPSEIRRSSPPAPVSAKPACTGTARSTTFSPAKVVTRISLPRDELEVDLLRYLHTRFGHVSYERIVSGPGLVNVFNF